MSIDLQWVSLDSVCTLEKGAINPQLHPETKFAHYSIPAFDEFKEPAIEYGSAIKSNKTKISKKAVLVSKLNPRIPRVWLVRDELGLPRICSTEFVPFIPDETQLDREYLYWSLYWLLIAGTIKGSTLAATKSRERAKPSDIARQHIPLPSIPEQRRLVDILSRAEGIVRLRREAQKKTQELIPALFLDMFGDPATNPRRWPVVTIGQVIESADYGSSKKASDDGTGFPIIRMGNVDYAGYLDLSDLKYVDFLPEEVEHYRLQEGDLLFNRTNSKELVGKTGLWNESCEAVAASYFIRVRVQRDRLNPFYLWAFMNTSHMKKILFETARGAIGQANINARELRAFQIGIPSLALQDSFEQRCRDVFSIQSQQSIALEKAEATFQSLLHRAFSGRL